MKKFILTGHVDHGKSTFCGRLLVNYNKEIDTYKVDKLKNESPNNWLGQLLDIYEEERERNKTFEWSSISITEDIILFDTPGHKIFIREFLQALTLENIPNIILCISGKIDEFDSGFRSGFVKEYIKIIRAVGITNIIVLWTKQIPIEKDKIELNKFLKYINFNNIIEFNIDSVNNIGIEEIWNYLNNTNHDNTIHNNHLNMHSIQCISRVVGEIRFLHNDIYMSGYIGIAHLLGNEIQFEFDKFEVDGRIVNFINSNKIQKAKVSIIFEKPTVISKRFILRNRNNDTIGFVIITK